MPGAAVQLRALPREAHASLALAAGLTSAATIFLYTKGYRQEAVTITIGAAILGAFLSAAKLLEGSPS